MHDHDHHPEDAPEALATHRRHGHTHGAVEPTVFVTDRGVWAVKWSLIGMLLTAILQATVFGFTGSVALMADTIHNAGDALTAFPLLLAFSLAARLPTKRFTHGYGRVEDLAGFRLCGGQRWH